MKLWHQFIPLAVFPLALLAVPAHAQLTLNLANTSQVGNPGDTLNFTGTLSNPTLDSVFLNSDNPTFNGPGTTDGSPFLINAPLSLDPAGTTDGNGNPTDSYSGPFFDVTLDPNAAPGTYKGTFTITGGADVSAADNVATEDFSVTVLSAPAVPEASSMVSLGVLLALGLGGLVVSARRRKSASL